MSTVTLGGNPFNTSGSLPAVGSSPAFALTKGDLSPTTQSDYAGQRVVLNIFPSVDTPTCAQSVRTFNQRAGEAPNTVVLCVSADLPFAQGRFCGAEGLSNVQTASSFRNPEFGADFGLSMVDGPLAGLLARAVVVLDESGKVVHTELVSEIAHEPNYDAALNALK
jgi:thioredoxin-dependent peroxiredoxin